MNTAIPFPILTTERPSFVREGTQRRYSLEDDGEFYDSAIFG